MPVLDPLRALRHRATRGSGLGYIFTAWGLLLAVFAIFVAPRRRAQRPRGPRAEQAARPRSGDTGARAARFGRDVVAGEDAIDIEPRR